jgi:hypothetical protein
MEWDWAKKAAERAAALKKLDHEMNEMLAPEVACTHKGFERIVHVGRDHPLLCANCRVVIGWWEIDKILEAGHATYTHHLYTDFFKDGE